jgi:hypothetical protein
VPALDEFFRKNKTKIQEKLRTSPVFVEKQVLLMMQLIHMKRNGWQQYTSYWPLIGRPIAYLYMTLVIPGGNRVM